MLTGLSNTAHGSVDGFDFPLGKPNGIGYAPNGLEFLDSYDYQSDGYPEYHPGEDWNDDNSGLDYGGDSNDAGDPIYAIASGVIKYAAYCCSGWGDLVSIEHYYSVAGASSTKWSLYGHMASISNNPRTSLPWAVGDTIYRGEQIGTVGDYPSGEDTNYHLHFELRKKYQVATAFPYNTSLDNPWPTSEVQNYYADPSDFINLNRPTITISGTISSSTSWPAGRNFVLDGTVTVDTGVTLTVDPGAIVKFKTITSKLELNGTLDAQGTASNKVYFTSYKDDSAGGDTNEDATSTAPSAGDWDTIKLNSSATSTLAYAVVRYGGHVGGGASSRNIYNDGGRLSLSNATVATSSVYGIFHSSGTSTISASDIHHHDHGFYSSAGAVSISTSAFHDNTSYGINASGPGSVTLTNNTFSNNSSGAAYVYLVYGDTGLTFTHSGNTASGSGKGGFVMDGGTLTTDQTWTKDGLPYIILNADFTVPSGKTLTIEPGVVVKFNGVASKLTIAGTLSSQGASASSVYFTSLKDDNAGGDTNGDAASTAPVAGDWDTIQFDSGASSTIAYAVIRYGGYTASGRSKANLYNNGGNLVLSNAIVATSTNYGIRAVSGTSTVVFSDIHNQVRGLYVEAGVVSVSSSSIHGNYPYGILNTSGSSMYAKNNYWGASDGPSGVGPGSGDPVSSNVDYTPWLSSWP